MMFLKCYLTIDTLHTIFNSSYQTYISKIFLILEFYFNNIIKFDFNKRYNEEWISVKDFEISSIIDATECPIRRPKDFQKMFYSGYKKMHTLKVIFF